LKVGKRLLKGGDTTALADEYHQIQYQQIPEKPEGQQREKQVKLLCSYTQSSNTITLASFHNMYIFSLLCKLFYPSFPKFLPLLSQITDYKR